MQDIKNLYNSIKSFVWGGRDQKPAELPTKVDEEDKENLNPKQQPLETAEEDTKQNDANIDIHQQGKPKKNQKKADEKRERAIESREKTKTKISGDKPVAKKPKLEDPNQAENNKEEFCRNNPVRNCYSLCRNFVVLNPEKENLRAANHNTENERKATGPQPEPKRTAEPKQASSENQKKFPSLDENLRNQISDHARPSLEVKDNWICKDTGDIKGILRIHEICQKRNVFGDINGFVALATYQKGTNKVAGLFGLEGIKPTLIKQWINKEKALKNATIALKKTSKAQYEETFDKIYKRHALPVPHTINPAATSANQVIWNEKELELSWNDIIGQKMPNQGNVYLEIWTTEGRKELPKFKYTTENIWTSEAQKLKTKLNKKKCNCNSICTKCLTANEVVFDYNKGRLILESEKIEMIMNPKNKEQKFVVVPICSTELCVCSKCPLKAVNKGSTFSVIIFSEKKYYHYGVRAVDRILEGSYITCYVGKVMTLDELSTKLANKGSAPYSFTLADDLVIDAEDAGDFSRFFGHSCTPNMTIAWLVPPGESKTGKLILAFFALKNIEPGEDMTFNYQLDPETTGTKIKCNCMDLNNNKCANWYAF